MDSTVSGEIQGQELGLEINDSTLKDRECMRIG